MGALPLSLQWTPLHRLLVLQLTLPPLPGLTPGLLCAQPQCRKACPTGYLPCGPYCFSTTIPAVTGILNASTSPAACAAFLALFSNCIPKCP